MATLGPVNTTSTPTTQEASSTGQMPVVPAVEPSFLNKCSHFFFSKFFSPFVAATKPLRYFTVVDLTVATSNRVINRVSNWILGRTLVDEEEAKTASQRNREREIIDLKAKFPPNAPHLPFAKAVDSCVSTLIPKIAGEQLSNVPPALEMLGLYWTGIPFRYLNRQLDKNTGYREKVVSDMGLQALDVGVRTKSAHFLAMKENLLPFFNTELIVLKALAPKETPATEGKPADAIAEEIPGIVLKSIATSLSRQKAIDAYIAERPYLNSDEKRLMARLDWLKENHALCSALPDPEVYRLEPENLNKAMDDALCKYLEPIVAQALDRYLPAAVTQGLLLRIAYKLEGKEFLVKQLTSIFVNLLFKQVADPHLLTTAVLFGRGIEVARYEEDGFGQINSQDSDDFIQGKLEQILNVGRSMLAQTQNAAASASSVVEIFKESKLRSSPKGAQAEAQKYEARMRLKSHIATLLHDAIKSDTNYPDKLIDAGFFKTLYSKIQGLPVIGIASMGVRGLLNSIFYSFQYMMSDSNKTAFGAHMAKNLTGQRFCDLVAERVVDLIYHPSWRVTLTELLVSFIDRLHHNKGKKAEVTREDFSTVVDFLFTHFAQNSVLPTDQIKPILSFLVDDAFTKFTELLKPKAKKPVVDSILELLTPTLKEFTLYWRVCEIMRNNYISFESDTKFWEFFIRGYLYQRTTVEFSQKKEATMNAKTEYRQKEVEKLLDFDDTALLNALRQLPPKAKPATTKPVVPKELSKSETMLKNPETRISPRTSPRLTKSTPTPHTNLAAALNVIDEYDGNQSPKAGKKQE